VVEIEGSAPEAADVLAAEGRGDEHRTEVADGELRVYGVEATAIGDVVATLETAGIAYTEVSWSQPSLEDVYLSLTGEAFEPDDGEESVSAIEGGAPA
jgi:ABC-2 type transport system ATP-binding protein